jgi:hypothetical protein
MRNYEIKYLASHIMARLTEIYGLSNDSFSELKKRLEIEVKARLVLVSLGGTTFIELVNGIIDQIQINKLIINYI